MEKAWLLVAKHTIAVIHVIPSCKMTLKRSGEKDFESSNMFLGFLVQRFLHAFEFKLLCYAHQSESPLTFIWINSMVLPQNNHPLKGIASNLRVPPGKARAEILSQLGETYHASTKFHWPQDEGQLKLSGLNFRRQLVPPVSNTHPTPIDSESFWPQNNLSSILPCQSLTIFLEHLTDVT